MCRASLATARAFINVNDAFCLLLGSRAIPGFPSRRQVDGLQGLRPLGNDQIARQIVHLKVNKKLPAWFFLFVFFCLQHSGNVQALSATCNKAFCPGATTEAMRGSVLCPGCQQPQRAAEPGLPHTLPREAAPPAFWGVWEAVPASHVHFALFHSHNGAPIHRNTGL